ncbi:hypothetical protein HAV21_03295 [Paenarthrobacter sp. MSM-2-10-13]|uniref:hypothetical protein n=1 Tax=Paenarthrobacter sp. MSM-2-10-13 TaxID=2717318 RepID=UPI0014247322|nr:hypothetical protein [Paenarthrobacter sp. MSM-2-10-13]NHW45923.1 hypothetical protein [Paenarthrobacter sp. MSM-2-10-13]
MNVASLELCKELHELSGWDGYSFDWIEIPTWNPAFPNPAEQVVHNHICDSEHQKWIAPAYDLGCLLRELPRTYEPQRSRHVFHLTVMNGNYFHDNWIADYWSPASGWLNKGNLAKNTEADSPEDAAAKLAIELFKQGILTRTGDE